MDQKIAVFITPHGFGHAARAVAVASALKNQSPTLDFEFFSTVPEWFITEALGDSIHYHKVEVDIGLIQSSPMQEDLGQTVSRLKRLIPFNSETVQQLAQTIKSTDCKAVLCDIAPLGIAAAQAAGVPSILEENFTWDWIYEGYLDQEPEIARFIEPLRSTFRSAAHHIQTSPVTVPSNSADLITSPVSRKPRKSKSIVRNLLGAPVGHKMVLVTMGGIPPTYSFIHCLPHDRNITFVIPGASDRYERVNNLILLPHHSSYYHPDLLNASDAVIGKSGYSTIAEAFHAGIPFGFVSRKGFRESRPMAEFIISEMKGLEVDQHDFETGKWSHILDELLSQPRVHRPDPNGSDQIADYIMKHIL